MFVKLMNSKTNTDSKEYFRILYFFSIIMVLDIHVNFSGIIFLHDIFNPALFVLYIFMFASGYFFVKEEYEKPSKYIYKKIKQLIIPLYLWNLVYAIIIFILRNLDVIDYGSKLQLSTLILNPIYSGHAYSLNCPSWFLMPLFMVQIFSMVFIPLLKKDKGIYIVFPLYIILGFAGIKLSMSGFRTDWWICLNRFLCMLPFFGLGLIYKLKLESLDKLSNTLYFSIVFCLQLFLIFFSKGLPNYVPANCGGFDSLIKPILYGYLGIFLWLRIAKIIAPLIIKNKIVNLISNNTFSIMMHHLFGFLILNLFFLVGKKYFNIFKSFNTNAFKGYVYYYFYPENIPQLKILYIIFGLVFSLALNEIIKRIIKIISKKINKARIK